LRTADTATTNSPTTGVGVLDMLRRSFAVVAKAGYPPMREGVKGFRALVFALSGVSRRPSGPMHLSGLLLRYAMRCHSAAVDK
jgi:hypothetical protein